MNLEELATRLRSLAEMIQTEDFGEAINAAGKAMYDDALYCFQNQCDPYGVPWEPLKSRSGQTLILTGQLEDGVIRSFANPTGTHNSIRVEYIGPEYGLYHQEGTETIPQRVFFGLSSPTLVKVFEAVVGAMLEDLKNVANGT